MLLLRGATGGARSGCDGDKRFNTCSSCEEQPVRPVSAASLQVSIHAPLARSNYPSAEGIVCFPFQYMLLLRGATSSDIQSVARKRFQYMLLLRGATSGFPECSRTESVSIHAPLARSNSRGMQLLRICSGFNTCSSCEEQHERERGGDRRGAVSIHAPLARSNLPVPCSEACGRFQYMLLLRGATITDRLYDVTDKVSIHAPLARSNLGSNCIEPLLYVSIHAPLARSNSSKKQENVTKTGFNTCSSCEEQLRRESRNTTNRRFNTCSSCEEQHRHRDKASARRSFNTCSSCEEQPLFTYPISHQ